MKKRIVISAVAVLLLVLTFSFVLAGQKRGLAGSEKEAFQMDGTTLMKYMGSSEVVYVPDSVRVIGYGAFEDNDYIKKVVLPARLETIEYNAFAECDNLLEIDIPDSVTKIGSAAFANCKSLSDVYIGKSVEEIGSGIFAGCSSLKDLDVSTKSTTLTCLDSVLMSADRTFIYQMLPGREEPFYIMNERVEEIGQYAFWGCNNLEHVILSDKIQVISPYAFSNASKLKSVSMSFAVTEIKM
ncbi:MAG: leucine-rich repeat domain-containing protein, partial [Lachnospiraceae bacterium]|nr:leucine-rich repeat domain-containing protein [Lachnospiraceae bacterium]